MGMDDGEPVEVVAGGFGGAIGGGFRKDKSFGSTEGGFGAGIEGGCMVARSRVFKSPRKSGGGGIHSLGGGGGATEGGGGTNISPLSRLGTEVMEPLDNGSQPTVDEKTGQMRKVFAETDIVFKYAIKTCCINKRLKLKSFCFI